VKILETERAILPEVMTDNNEINPKAFCNIIEVKIEKS